MLDFASGCLTIANPPIFASRSHVIAQMSFNRNDPSLEVASAAHLRHASTVREHHEVHRRLGLGKTAPDDRPDHVVTEQTTPANPSVFGAAGPSAIPAGEAEVERVIKIVKSVTGEWTTRR
jgi:hypothetical protein